jgi:hypothetical protein
MRSKSTVVRSRALLQPKAVTRGAIARHDSDPVFAVELFGVEVRREQAIIASSQGEFKARGGSREEVVLECGPSPLQGAADCRLTQPQAGGHGGDALLLGDHSKGNQKVQIDLAQFL